MVFPIEEAIKDIVDRNKPEEMTVVKRVSFDAAHYLPDYEGKCSQMHGHHWVVELGVRGKVQENGMVIDFALLKKFLDEVEEEFDHTCLNDTPPFKEVSPTAENICLFIKDWFLDWWWATDLRKRKDIEIKLDFIRVWETGDSYAELH